MQKLTLELSDQLLTDIISVRPDLDTNDKIIAETMSAYFYNSFTIAARNLRTSNIKTIREALPPESKTVVDAAEDQLNALILSENAKKKEH